ncbi:hypothetical protein [Streptomyces adonidis]|uniref:hypothetical protein n=1 Tax=Streptomyces adonidis TaxID=3231367 RepID=UPI0034DB0D6F
MTGPAPELPPAPGPGAWELAALLSFATRIEPELIRAVRLRLLPHLDVGAEADLWFSDWVGARTPEAIALLPECLPHLRGVLVDLLAADPRLGQVVDIVTELHRDLSPALFLEEQITWHSLHGDTEKATEHLNRALHALVRERRTGLAGWFAEAWHRLPAEARATPAARTLAHAALAHVPSLDPDTGPELTLAEVATVAEAVGEVRIGVFRDGDALVLGDETGVEGVWGNGARAILVPDTRPRVVAVVTESESRLVRFADGVVTSLEEGTGRVELRTGAGHVYVIEPPVLAPTEPDDPAPFRFPAEEELHAQLAEGVRAELTARLTRTLQNLLRRFRDADDYGALTRAVRLAERALETGYEAQDWPGFGCAAAEAQYLLGAYRGSRRPLERAVEISSRVWSTAGEGLAVRAWTVCGAAHRELFAYTGDIFDLQAALDALQPQVRRARGGDRGWLLTELLRTYVVFHGADPNGDHLSRALELSGRAIRSPEEEQETALALARVYLARHEVTGYPGELARVEGVARLASPTSLDSARAETWAVEAELSLHRFRTEGVWDDLDAAVNGLRGVLRLLPGDSQLRRAQLSVALADALRLRYRLLKDREALDEARHCLREALALLPEPSVWRRAALNGLNRCLIDAYREDGDLADLDEAVDVAREAAHAVRACPSLPHTHVARAQLSEALIMRHRAIGDPASLDEAVDVLRSADIDSPPVRPAVRVDHAVALASALLERRDLAAALEVLDGLPEGVPPTARLLTAEIVVGMGVESRLREAQADMRGLFARTSVPPHQRLAAARLWARLAELTDDPDDLVRSHEAVSEDLPPALLLSLGEREHLCVEWEARAREAAACAIEVGRPERALEFLEEREEVLSARVARRPGIDLTPELTRLWAHLDLRTNAAEPQATLRPDRMAATLYRLIRTMPVPVTALLSAASEGPVVVLNAARRRCDALVVALDGVTSMKLPFGHDVLAQRAEDYARVVALSDAEQRASGMTELFGWLSSRTVEPVMGGLGTAGDSVDRIWWCPNGLFTKLPVHAVETGQMVGVVTSYTPSLRALMTARDRMRPAFLVDPRSTLVVLADGGNPVRVMSPGATILRGANATVARVTAELARSRRRFFQYDGPAHFDGAPRLHLADGVLDWRDLPEGVVPDGAMIYLAGWDEPDPDNAPESEIWRILAAFQAAGYSHVLAMQGTADDRGIGVADSVYREFIRAGEENRPDSVARLLHRELPRIGPDGTLFKRAAVKHLGP